MIMNKLLIICLLVLGLLTMTACSTTKSNNIIQKISVQKISDIQKPENINNTVTVQGRVVSTLESSRLGISGYKIQDSTGTIDVSSKKVPQVNTTVTVTGTLIQTRFFGIVINATD
jgi:DNA/RNA endonuclease YhcR with UshA esterase domain